MSTDWLVVSPVRSPLERLATPERILKAAAQIFARDGRTGATIRDIATQADVNLAAINYHFRSKDELFDRVIERALAQAHAAIDGHWSGVTPTPRDAITAIVDLFLGDGSQTRWTGALLRQLALSHAQHRPGAARMKSTMAFERLLTRIGRTVAPSSTGGSHDDRRTGLAVIGVCVFVADQPSESPDMKKRNQIIDLLVSGVGHAARAENDGATT